MAGSEKGSVPHALVHRRNFAQGQEIPQAVARDHPYQPSGVADERVVQPQQSESYVHLGQLRGMAHLSVYWEGGGRERNEDPKTKHVRRRQFKPVTDGGLDLIC